MAISDRADRMNLPNAGILADVVSDVYGRSSGKPSPTFAAFECGECGCTHAGRDAAEECCTETEWYEDADEDADA